MTIQIPAGGLTLSDGDDRSASVTLHVHFDVCPTWLLLALNHLRDAQAREVERMAVWNGEDGQAKALALEAEFEASMQAMMASAIAMDAFHAVISDKIQISRALRATWRKNRTARYVQVAETLRQAFRLKGRPAEKLRECLREIYKFRDLAVHPSGAIQAPVLHPELDVGVEWRFASFRCRHAEIIVGLASQILAELVNVARPRNEAVKQYVGTLRTRLQELR